MMEKRKWSFDATYCSLALVHANVLNLFKALVHTTEKIYWKTRNPMALNHLEEEQGQEENLQGKLLSDEKCEVLGINSYKSARIDNSARIN